MEHVPRFAALVRGAATKAMRDPLRSGQPDRGVSIQDDPSRLRPLGAATSRLLRACFQYVRGWTCVIWRSPSLLALQASTEPPARCLALGGASPGMPTDQDHHRREAACNHGRAGVRQGVARIIPRDEAPVWSCEKWCRHFAVRRVVKTLSTAPRMWPRSWEAESHRGLCGCPPLAGGSHVHRRECSRAHGNSGFPCGKRDVRGARRTSVSICPSITCSGRKPERRILLPRCRGQHPRRCIRSGPWLRYIE